MDLYVDGVLLTFDQLSLKYDIPKKHFFKYLQLKILMSSIYKQIMYVPPLLKLEEITLSNLESKGLLSKYYNLLVDDYSEEMKCLGNRYSRGHRWDRME